jgi:hypothetical protein
VSSLLLTGVKVIINKFRIWKHKIRWNSRELELCYSELKFNIFCIAWRKNNKDVKKYWIHKVLLGLKVMLIWKCIY